MYMDEEYLDHQRRVEEANFLNRGCLRGLAIMALAMMMFIMIIILIMG